MNDSTFVPKHKPYHPAENVPERQISPQEARRHVDRRTANATVVVSKPSRAPVQTRDEALRLALSMNKKMDEMLVILKRMMDQLDKPSGSDRS